MTASRYSKPDPRLAQQMTIARQLHQAGRLEEARSAYDEVLRENPLHPDALLGSGMLAHQRGNHGVAADLLSRAIAQSPDVPHLHCNLALVLAAMGRQEDAVRAYQKAIDLNPDYAEAHFNMGILLRQRGDLEGAIGHYRHVLRLKPGFAPAYSSLGNALRERGDLAAAVDAFKQALQGNPGSAATWFNLAGTLKDLDRLDEAAEKYRQALSLKPDYADAYGNLGHLQALQSNYQEAAISYAQALAITPRSAELRLSYAAVLKEVGRLDEAAENIAFAAQTGADQAPACAAAFFNLGLDLHQQRRPDAAIGMYRRALRLKPDFPVAHLNLGNTYAEIGDMVLAAECFECVLAIDPASAPAYCNLGNLHLKQRRMEDAVACYRKAVELDPAHVQATTRLMYLMQCACQWQDLDTLTGRVIELFETGTEVDSPFPLLAIGVSEERQLRCAQKYARQAFGDIAVPPEFLHARKPKDKITVGYLSGDFRQHAVAYLAAELFERHDRGRFRILGYSYGPDDGSPLRQRLMRGFDSFVDIRTQSFMESARRIFDDGVDILVDLTGYTESCRTSILALRPAPIQVSYLGYIGTMGAEFIDYIIADRFVIPPDRQFCYAEKVVYLPDCYQVNDGRRPQPAEGVGRAESGLPEHGFVFCCFNNSYKLTARIFDVWMRLLHAVPGSVLWLSASSSAVSDNLRREALTRGIAPERILFAPVVPQAEYLAQYRNADLFLDTPLYNAGATASDALWAGCPVVTCAGDTFAARMAGSILHAAGLPELVTHSLADYETLARRLAQNPEALAAVKKRLRENAGSAPLFDCARFTGNIETAYRRMWDIHLSGGLAEPIDVSGASAGH